MQKFNHVEDYIELIAGIKGTGLQGLTILLATPIVSLARYDVSIVSSLANQSCNGVAYTDKQSVLAVKIVGKYRRQLHQQNIDIGDIVDKPKFRLPIRVIDRSKRIYIDNDELIVKFAYDSKIINSLKEIANRSQGNISFDSTSRSWRAAITEYNISSLIAFGQVQGFEIDPVVNSFMAKIVELETKGYAIELAYRDNVLHINNAAPTLIDYIDNKLGGIRPENIIKLIDYAPVLGYTVHSDLQQCVREIGDSVVEGLVANSLCHYQRSTNSKQHADQMLEHISKYCDLVDRWPLIIYESDSSSELKQAAIEKFGRSSVLDLTNKKSAPDNVNDYRCIYLNKMSVLYKKVSIDNSLLLSTSVMFRSSERDAIVASAHKTVFYTPTTLNTEAAKIAG